MMPKKMYQSISPAKSVSPLTWWLSHLKYMVVPCIDGSPIKYAYIYIIYAHTFADDFPFPPLITGE